jgi:hypothetical protein
VTRVAVTGRVALLTAVVVLVAMMTGTGAALGKGEPLPAPTEAELVRAETAVLGAQHAALHAARRRHARTPRAAAAGSSSAADSVALLGVGDASVVGTVVGIRARCCCRMG